MYISDTILAGQAASALIIYLAFQAHTNCCEQSPIAIPHREKSKHKKWIRADAAIFLFVPAVKLNLILGAGQDTALCSKGDVKMAEGHPVWEIIICRRIIHAINVK